MGENQIALLAQSLHNSHLKRTFLQSFANDPAKFIQTWLESQSKDLESVLGAGSSEGLTLRQEELRRSEFFRLPWVEEVMSFFFFPNVEGCVLIFCFCSLPFRRYLYRRVFGWLRNRFEEYQKYLLRCYVVVRYIIMSSFFLS